MNLFVLDESPKLAAQSLIDQHVNKMILETAQILDGGTRYLLSNLRPRANLEIVKIPPSHRDNPIIRSADSRQVWEWAFAHLRYLLREFAHRYQHGHAYSNNGLTERLLDRYQEVRGAMPDHGFYMAMPDRYRLLPDRYVTLPVAISSYRGYYVSEKMTYGSAPYPATWTRRPPPPWLDRLQCTTKARRVLGEGGRWYFLPAVETMAHE